MNRTIATIAAIVILLNVFVAVLVSENSSYIQSITVHNGKTYVETEKGTLQLTSIEYIKLSPAIKPMPITRAMPVMLPNTSEPHGKVTCDYNGSKVTRDSCDDL